MLYWPPFSMPVTVLDFRTSPVVGWMFQSHLTHSFSLSLHSQLPSTINSFFFFFLNSFLSVLFPVLVTSGFFAVVVVLVCFFSALNINNFNSNLCSEVTCPPLPTQLYPVMKISAPVSTVPLTGICSLMSSI